MVKFLASSSSDKAGNIVDGCWNVFLEEMIGPTVEMMRSG